MATKMKLQHFRESMSTKISLLSQLIISFFLKSETSTQEKKSQFHFIFYFRDVLY